MPPATESFSPEVGSTHDKDRSVIELPSKDSEENVVATPRGNKGDEEDRALASGTSRASKSRPSSSLRETAKPWKASQARSKPGSVVRHSGRHSSSHQTKKPSPVPAEVTKERIICVPVPSPGIHDVRRTCIRAWPETSVSTYAT